SDLARRLIESCALVGSPGPECFAGTRVDGNHIAALADGEGEDAVGHDRRRLAGAAAKIVEPPAPRHLQVLDVVASNLIEGRVAGASHAARVCPPLAVPGSVLRHSRR